MTQSGSTVTGDVSNCASAASNVGMVVVAAYLNPDGTISNQVIDQQTTSAGAGEKVTFVSTLPECTVKVLLYKGDNENNPANQLTVRFYNTSKYCTEQPTATPLPPTDTPVPPTATPLPPTDTPVPPTATAVPPTAVPPTATPQPPGGGQGCTPGYWKQPHHFDSWVNYSPTDNYEAVFGVDASFNKDLVGALAQGGGGEKALGRHAVAALLNANTSGVSFLYTQADVIAMVQGAYATGDFEGVKNLFATQNEMGCPLN
ncbi:MAG: hypothetical protein HC804_10795 [Anaerolineae bacterium]|nr:hypothetical protein [Anaerolineae bacterium]